MMGSDTYVEILDRLNEHRKHGFKVPAVRISTEQYRNLCTRREFVRPEHPDMDFELEYDEAVGMAAGTEIIVDSNISGVVAEDVVKQ